MKSNRDGESGQVALAILLIMGVVLTITLAVANRTTQDIANTIQTTSAARVFSQAESASEAVLNGVIENLQAGIIPPEIAAASAEVVPVDGVRTDTTLDHATVFSQTLAAGETAQIILDPDGTGVAPPYTDPISITWAREDGLDDKASLIVTEYFVDSSDEIRSRYQFYRPCNATDRSDGFLATSICPSEPPTTITYNTTSDPLLLRIQAVYNSTDLTVQAENSSNPLPVQQFVITTKAVNTEEDIQQNSVLEVTASHLLPPPFLDYALYSGGDLVKP